MYNYSANTLFIGNPLIYLPSCHSTNDIACEMVSNPDLTEGTAVITSCQTAGKGQRGNSWEAEPGMNITLSIVLKPGFLPVDKQFLLNEVISLAVSDVVTRYLGNKVKIKWPNDIFFEDRKICGILIRNFIKKGQIDAAVAGIGLNVNQEVFADKRAISIKQILGREVPLQEVLDLLLMKTESYYLMLREGKTEEVLKLYLRNLYWIGEERTFKAEVPFRGTITGIDDIGRLMIRKGDELLTFGFKEVEFENPHTTSTGM